MNNSPDPRVRRLSLEETGPAMTLQEGEHWNIYEVFRQDKRGARHVHVGALHAPNGSMALVFAKEQYGRRKDCFNLWVVRSADILAFDDDQADMFFTNREKTYRDASGFKVGNKINAFKKSRSAEEP
ncbi:MAG TPA: 1,2-phenylacetyl-CoA epoxidase subunit B [Chitinophagaceae bacterium]|nr:1,2-phenylacetyl-CoA epoxidase subunit B [Chitinophagaceae bacterium]